MNAIERRKDEQPRDAARSHTNPATVVESRDLFRGKRELQISHEGEVYRLRVTRNGRLILNK